MARQPLSIQVLELMREEIDLMRRLIAIKERIIILRREELAAQTRDNKSG